MLDKIFSQHPTIYKYDRTWIGIALGLIVPTLGFVLVYLLSVLNHYQTGDSIVSIPTMLQNVRSLLLISKFLSVGCILNLGVFFLFINRDYFNISRGVILATMIIALPVMATTIKSWFM
jgi:hypothetical protein